MPTTVGEAITAGLRSGANAGSEAVAYNAQLRERARLNLLKLAQLVMGESPAWWRNCDADVVILANTSQIPLPYDFGGVGTNFQVYVPSLHGRELISKDAVVLEQARQQDLTRRGDPEWFTLKQVTPTQGLTGLPPGTKMIDVWPTPPTDVTLSLKNYMRGCPPFVDCPLAPGVAIGPAGLLTGSYVYAMTFVHLVGGTEYETEGGFVSSIVSPVAQMVNLTKLQVSPVRTVTDRLLYRTEQDGLPPLKLIGNLGDNRTTTYQDNTIDGDLLPAELPTVSDAVSGLELFPLDWHELVFVDGLISMLRAHVKQIPFEVFDRTWGKNVKRMWADQRNDRHVGRVMPAYGSGYSVPRRWRQLA